MVDKAAEMQKELDGFWQKFGKFNAIALERKEQWLNSSMADMPHWDRVLVEYIMHVEQEMQVLRDDVKSIMEFMRPEPVFEKEDQE